MKAGSFIGHPMNELRNGHVKAAADTVIGNPIQFCSASRRVYIYIYIYIYITTKRQCCWKKTNRNLRYTSFSWHKK
jgi:hypothetical protein